MLAHGAFYERDIGHVQRGLVEGHRVQAPNVACAPERLAQRTAGPGDERGLEISHKY